MGLRIFHMTSGDDCDDEQLRGIDQQHLHIYQLVKDFSTALHGGCDRDRLLPILEETIRSARVNFATEERLLRDVDNSGYQTHRNAHRLINDELKLFHGFVVASRSVTFAQCVHAMDSLLVHHIQDDPTYFAHDDESLQMTQGASC
jgi:hemerythrin-like metal-binding protein